MISSTLIQAAEVLSEALTPQDLSEAGAKRAMADVGLGYHGVNRFIDDITPLAEQNGVSVEDATTYAFLIGVLSERLDQRLAQDPDVLEQIQAIVRLHPHNPKEKLLGFIDEMADILYNQFDINVPDTMTGHELIKLARDKYQEVGDTVAAETLENILAKVDAATQELDNEDDAVSEL